MISPPLSSFFMLSLYFCSCCFYILFFPAFVNILFSIGILQLNIEIGLYLVGTPHTLAFGTILQHTYVLFISQLILVLPLPYTPPDSFPYLLALLSSLYSNSFCRCWPTLFLCSTANLCIRKGINTSKISKIDCIDT